MPKRISIGSAVWSHHPRGGIVTGYAGKCQHSGFGWRERGISIDRESAKLGRHFTHVPVSQVYPLPDINRILARPAHNASSKYGAQMGRRNQTQGAPELLHLQRVRFVDGDYDTGGAYWGGGRDSLPIYCAFSPDTTTNEVPIRVFVRAANADDAKLAVQDKLQEEGFTFLVS